MESSCGIFVAMELFLAELWRHGVCVLVLKQVLEDARCVWVLFALVLSHLYSNSNPLAKREEKSTRKDQREG